MPRAQMTITLEDDGSVTIAGPLKEPVLLYGLLGAAHHAIKDFQTAQPDPNRIQLAPGPLPRQ